MASGLSLHSFEILAIGFRARDRARVDAQRPNALTEDAIVSIIMSAAATEAFIHELAERARMWDTHVRMKLNDPEPRFTAFAAAMEELEDSHASVTLKYLIASLVISGQSFSKNVAPFQPFADLVRLRNALMHLKPAVGDDPHLGRKLANALAQRGLALPVEDGAAEFSWFNRLETPRVAEWACDTARSIIIAVLDLVPEACGRHLGFLDQHFRSHPIFANNARTTDPK